MVCPVATAYRRFLGETLLSMPGVRETRTYAVMEEIKRDAPLPLDYAAIVVAVALEYRSGRKIALSVQSQRLSSNALVVF